MYVLDQTLRVVAGASHRVAEDQRDQQDPDRVVPIEKLEAIVLDALVGIGPGAPANGARDHHQQRDTQCLWRIHRGSFSHLRDTTAPALATRGVRNATCPEFSIQT